MKFSTAAFWAIMPLAYCLASSSPGTAGQQEQESINLVGVADISSSSQLSSGGKLELKEEGSKMMETVQDHMKVAEEAAKAIKNELVDAQIQAASGGENNKAAAVLVEGGIKAVRDTAELLKDVKADAEAVLAQLMQEEALAMEPNNGWASLLVAQSQDSLEQINKALELLPKIVGSLENTTKEMRGDLKSKEANAGDSQEVSQPRRLQDDGLETATLKSFHDGKKKKKRGGSKSDNPHKTGHAAANEHLREARKQRRILRRKLEGHAHGQHLHDKFSRFHDALHGGDHSQLYSHAASSMMQASNIPGSRNPGERRRTQTNNEFKARQCRQLTTCVGSMSIYDMMLYFYSDDINPTSGEIDDNIFRHVNADDIHTVYDSPWSTRARSYVDSGDDVVGAQLDSWFVPSKETYCDSLLQQFHRNVEYAEVPHWEGATVSEVCHAQGGHTYVKLDEIATKVGLKTAELVSREMYNCSKDLYNSAANSPRLAPFPFARSQISIDSSEIITSSEFLPDYTETNVNNIVDGDLDTYWRSGLGSGGILKIDLGTDRCMEADSDNVVRSNSQGGCSTSSLNDMWHVSGLSYKSHKGSNNCLTISEETYDWSTSTSSDDFTDWIVKIDTCDSSDIKQKWFMDQWGRVHNLRNPHKCIEIYADSNNKPFRVRDCNYSMNRQKFRKPSVLAAQHYLYSPIVVQGRCLRIDPGSETMVRARECSDNWSDKSLWYYEPNGRQIKNKHNDNCLTRTGGGGDWVEMRACAGNNNQKWSYNTDNTQLRQLKLHQWDNTKCLTMRDGEGNKVSMTDCSPNDNGERWYFDHSFMDNHPRISFDLDFSGATDYNVDSVQINWYKWPNGQYYTCRKQDIRMYSHSNENTEIFFSWADDVLVRRNEQIAGGVYTYDETLTQTAILASGTGATRQIRIKCEHPTKRMVVSSIKLFGSQATGTPVSLSEFGGTYELDFLVPSGVETVHSRDTFGQLIDASQVIYEYEEPTVDAILAARHEMAEMYFLLWKHWLQEGQSVGSNYLRAEIRTAQGDPGTGGTYNVAQLYSVLDSYAQADYFIELLRKADDYAVLKEQLVIAFARFHGRAFATNGDLDNREDELDEFYETFVAYWTKIQTGFNLVFGKDAAVGYVCGIEDVVDREGADRFPGTCCLDAPFEGTGDEWGRKFDCSQTCQNTGPFLSGITENSCSAIGGSWCPTPTDCSRLQACVDSEIADANATGRLSYAAYLKPGTIADATDFQQCSDSRQYFGFDPLYKNDADICDNIKQLHNTHHFEFLEEFYNQGTPLGSGAFFGNQKYADSSEYTHVKINDAQWDDIDEVDTASSQSEPVQDGPVSWGLLYGLGVIKSAQEHAMEYLSDFVCAVVPPGSNVACVMVQNTMFTIMFVLHILLELAYDTTEYTLDFTTCTSNIQPIETWEAAITIPEQNKQIYKTLRETFEAVVTSDSNLNSLGDYVVKELDKIVTGIDTLTSARRLEEKAPTTTTTTASTTGFPEPLPPSCHHSFELQAEVVSRSSPKQILLVTSLNGAPVDYGNLAVEAIIGGGLTAVPYTLVSLQEGKVLLTLNNDSDNASVFSLDATYNVTTGGDYTEFHQTKLISFGGVISSTAKN